MSKKITAAGILTDARALIADPAHWIKGEYSSTNEAGETCYCSVGAVSKSARNNGAAFDSAFGKALECLYNSAPNGGIVAIFNDHPDTQHEDVLAMFDRAIDRAKAVAA